MTTQRTAILRNMQTALQAIQVGQSLPSAPVFGPVLFKTTVKSVEIVPRTWVPTLVAPDSTPMIGIMSGIERKSHLPGGMIWCDWQLLLSIFVDESDGLTRLALLDNLEDDIIAALSADTTLGKAAVRTTFIETDRDDVAALPQGTMKMLVETRYYRSVASS